MLENLFRGEHLLIILAIVMLMFPHKLAGLGGSLGKTIRDFKQAVSEPDQGAPTPPDPKTRPPESR